jgi:hypothetical protein
MLVGLEVAGAEYAFWRFAMIAVKCQVSTFTNEPLDILHTLLSVCSCSTFRLFVLPVVVTEAVPVLAVVAFAPPEPALALDAGVYFEFCSAPAPIGGDWCGAAPGGKGAPLALALGDVSVLAYGSHCCT